MPARKAHSAFIVEGLRELATTLQRAGYHVWKDQPLEGYDRLYVDDPFGNRIELMEPRRQPSGSQEEAMAERDLM